MARLAAVLVLTLVANLDYGFAQDFSYADIKDLLQVGGHMKITKIYNDDFSKNMGKSFDDSLENFIKSNEISMELPYGSSIVLNGRSLDDGEFDMKLRFGSGREIEGRKKSKIKKVLAPILVIVLLKAITLIPLALGILGIKTWNALQLSFVSFVTTVVLAVWKFCAKFSDHHPAPHIIHEAVHDVHVPHVYHDSHHDHHVVHHDHHHHDDHLDHYDVHHHDPWDHHYHRSDDSPQQLAYSGYTPPENKV